MLMPNRVKYRRPHRLSYEGRAKAGREITFGEYGLVADEGAYVSSNQLEAARVAMTRYMDRTGKVWIKVFPKMSHVKRSVLDPTNCASRHALRRRARLSSHECKRNQRYEQ